MRSDQVAFDIRGKGETPSPGHQFIKCHINFGEKMEDLQRKTRMVSGGLMTDIPPTIMYARVISRETVRFDLVEAVV